MPLTQFNKTSLQITDEPEHGMRAMHISVETAEEADRDDVLYFYASRAGSTYYKLAEVVALRDTIDRIISEVTGVPIPEDVPPAVSL